MPELNPLGPVSYALGSLTPTDFERLNWRLIRLKHPDALFLDNPDGGVDAILPSEDGQSYTRAWQSKRFTSSVSWPQCVKSLDAAVKNYKVTHVTFCFARNLTGKQQKSFVKHLATRIKGVRVDWIGAEVLHAELTATPEGVAVAKYFFGAPFDDKEALERAIALGGRVDTTEDVLAHLVKVQCAIDDPYFKVRTASHETGEDHIVPGDTVMSFIEQDGKRTAHIDIAPRDDEAMRLFAPEFTMDFTDDEAGRTASAAIEAALATDQAVKVEGGIHLNFAQYPDFLKQVFGETLVPDVVQLTPVERSTLQAIPWPAELSVLDAGDIAAFSVDLQPEPAPADWDAALAGSFGGAHVRLMYRWRDGVGELNINMRHERDASPAADQVVALRLLRAVSQGSKLVLADRTGDRPAITLGGEAATDFDDGSERILAFLEDVAFIETWAGVSLPLPPTLTVEEHQQVRQLAAMMRAGEASISFDQFELDTDAAGLAQLQAGGRLAWVNPEMGSRVLGVDVPLHAWASLEPYEVMSVEPMEGREGIRRSRSSRRLDTTTAMC